VLRERGWIEGQNIVIENRFAEGKVDRLSTLVAEFIRFKVDIIVTGSSVATGAAKNVRSTSLQKSLEDFTALSSCQRQPKSFAGSSEHGHSKHSPRSPRLRANPPGGKTGKLTRHAPPGRAN
jgi:hypothetical protein